MNDRRRSTAALGALIIVAAVGMFVTALPTGSPVTPKGSAVNELDVDLAAGTPMPQLPTAQPDGMSIVSADQALARGLRGMFFRPNPASISVRLLNHGIMNRLCGGTGGSMPEDELVWAFAFTQPGLTEQDIAGGFYNRHLPPLDRTPDPTAPTATREPSPTPEAVAGAVSVLVAGEGYLTYQHALFDPQAGGTHCPTFAMIRALRSLPDIITPRPTEPPHTPVPTSRAPEMSPLSSPLGITLTNRAIKVTVEMATPSATRSP